MSARGAPASFPFDESVLPAGEAPILVALSGGGDSTALLHALCERMPLARLSAAIVDHALRPGSEEDARAAAAAADDLGVRASVLALAWPGAPRRAQAPLRERRYAALCAHARAAGASTIALGHTADDQAETMLMRAARGGLWRGLAGIAPAAPAPVWPDGAGIVLARPLLRARRAELRDWLRARGVAWREDPANENVDYERVRARRRLAELEADGLDPMRFVALAARLREMARAVDAAAAAWLAAHLELDGPRARLPRFAFDGSDAATAGLAALIAAVSGRAQPMAAHEALRFAERLVRPSFTGATLAGVRAAPKGDAIVFDRDPGALSGRSDAPRLAAIPLEPGVPIVWDGRIELTVAEPDWSAEPPEAGRGSEPVVTRNAGRERVRLSEARKIGLVSAQWRLNDHLRHLLPAFTGP